MAVLTILLIAFLAITTFVWVMLRASAQGYERYETVFTETVESRMRSLFLFFDARKIFLFHVLAIVAVPILLFLLTGSVVHVVLALVIALMLPRWIVRILERRRGESITLALPDALAQIAGSMRAGATFVSGVETMVRETRGPIGQEFGLFLREQRLGKSQEEALDNLAERVASEEMDLVVTAAQISREVGGNLAEIFEGLSTTLRRKVEMEGKIKALTSQGKLQGWVVSLLPFFIIFALFYIEPAGIRPILFSLLGWIFLAVIVVLEVLGGLMIRKIVSIDI